MLALKTGELRFVVEFQDVFGLAQLGGMPFGQLGRVGLFARGKRLRDAGIEHGRIGNLARRFRRGEVFDGRPLHFNVEGGSCGLRTIPL